MSAHTRITKGVRLRNTEKSGEWLVAPYTGAARCWSGAEVRSAAGKRVRPSTGRKARVAAGGSVRPSTGGKARSAAGGKMRSGTARKVWSATGGKLHLQRGRTVSSPTQRKLISEEVPIDLRRRGAGKTVLDLSDILALIPTKTWEAQQEDLLLVSADDPATLEKARSLIELMGERLGDLEQAEMEWLINAAMPRLSEPPTPTVIDQARRNAEIRANFMQQYEMLDAEQVHALYGSTAKNHSALAARWRSDKKIFAVEHRGKLLYPTFQFDVQGHPKGIVAKVLAALGDAVGGWQTAIWFVTPNNWLDEKKPVDLLDREPARVLDVAADIAEPVTH